MYTQHQSIVKFVVLFAAIVCLNGITQPYGQNLQEGQLNVTGVVPLPTEPLQNRLVLFFDQVLDDSIDPEQLISWEPKLVGTTEVHGNRLDFYPQEIDPNQIYTATLNENLNSSSGLKLNPEHLTFEFAAQTLKPKNIRELSKEETRLTAAVEFTFPVELQTLREFVGFTDKNDQALNVEIEAGPNEKVFFVTTNGDLAWPVVLNVQSGLTDKKEIIALKENISHQFVLERPLQVQNLQWHDIKQNEQIITIRFSEPVAAEALQQHLDLTLIPSRDQLGFSLVTEGNRTEHQFKINAPNLQDFNMRVLVRKGLAGPNYYILQDDFARNLQNKMEPLTIQNEYWSYGGDKGKPLQIRFNHDIKEVLNRDDLSNYIKVVPEVTQLEYEFVPWNNNTIRIYGDWKEEFGYQIVVKAGMPYQSNYTLENDLVRHVETGTFEPFITTSIQDEFYFPRKSGLKFPLESRYTKDLNVELYRLFPSNIPAALENIDQGEGSNYFNSRWAEKVKQITVPVSGESHQLNETWIALDELFPEGKQGVFCIQVNSPKQSYPYQTRMIVYTDIGVMSHWTNDELVLFAHDLFTLEPLQNAAISVYSDKFQKLDSGFTDQQGLLKLQGFPKTYGEPKSVVIEHGNDFTFLMLQHRNYNSTELSGPAFDREGYDAFVYADRELYRPGETIHTRWLVRSHYGNALSDVPLIATVYKPNGKKLSSQTTTLSEWGSGGMEIETMEAYPTGSYEIAVSVPGTETPIGRMNFWLEDFVPQRMKAEVSLHETTWLSGETYTIDIQANHLFGPPATDRKSQAKVIFQKGKYQPDGWEQYTFGNDSDYLPSEVPLGEAWTDEEGKAQFDFQYTPSASLTYPLQAVVIGDVFELGGRTVSDRAVATFLPSELMLGVSASSSPSSRGVNVYVAALNAEGNAAEIPSASVTLEQEIWHYNVRRYHSHTEPEWSKTYNIIETKNVEINNGQGMVRLDAEDWGHYRLRVHHPKSPQYSSTSFFMSNGRAQIQEGTSPDLITLKLDQPTYNIGDTATLRIESPFDGKAIVVLQGEKFYQTVPVEITDSKGFLEIPVIEDFFPNVMVECTVVHEVNTERTQLYPYSSFAMKNLKVEDPRRDLVVTFPNLPEEIEPDSKVNFAVHVVDIEGLPVQAELTLAAVDEGIHAITNYKNPQPYEYFSRSRQPNFRRAHYYDQVLYDFKKLMPGGDMGLMLSGSGDTPLENWIKPVALWSGAVETDENGYASVEMDIPEFTGQLRLVVVASSKSAAGMGSENVFIRRPFSVRSSVARYLLPQDDMKSSFVIFNQSEQDSTVMLKWRSLGALIEQHGETQFSLEKGEETRHEINLTAGDLIGQGMIEWSAEFKDEEGNVLQTLNDEIALPVYAPATYQSDHQLIALHPGEEQTVTADLFIESRMNQALISVSANPALQLKDALSFLIQYPYGCIEQTLSRLFPLVVLKENQNLVQDALPDTSVDEFIRAGIHRLFAMQTVSGGLGYWPGASQPQEYSSIYGLHFLTLVKNKREFDIPQDGYNLLANYVYGLTQNWNDMSESGLFKRAYGLYVLALGGNRDALDQLHRFDDILVPRSSRYLLAAAMSIQIKDEEYINTYLSQAPSVPYTVHELGDTFNSSVRNQAIELLSLNQIGIQEERQAEIVQELIVYLKDKRYGNTQETAFTVTALGQYLEKIARNIDESSAEIQSPTQFVTITGRDYFKDKQQGLSLDYMIKNTSLSTPVYVSYTSKGIPKEPQTEAVSHGLKVNKRYYHGSEPHQGNTFKQGETYVMQIDFQTDRDLKNVVLVNLLAAGLEIENPRLDPDAIPGQEFEEAANPSHLEMRDDRVVFAFDELQKGSHRVYAIVRAVTPGEYQQPGVRAECMYDASIYGTTASGTVQIQ